MIIYIVALLCFAKPALILVVGLLFVGWSVGWLVCWFVGSWLLFIVACCLLLVVGGGVGVGGVVVVAVVAVVVVGGCGRCLRRLPRCVLFLVLVRSKDLNRLTIVALEKDGAEGTHLTSAV